MTAGVAEVEGVEFPPIDPTSNQLILCVGRKKSGKSQWAREAFRGWPGVDRLVIDPTGDADPGSPRRPGQPESWKDDLNTQTWRELPTALPERQKVHVPGQGDVRVPGVYRWIPNPMSKTYTDDLDRGIGLALFTQPRDRRVLLWADEAADAFPAASDRPYARTLLMQSRHWHTSALICCPRPMNIDPLVLAQADRVVMFDVPGVADRKRLSDVIGVPHAQLVALLNEIKSLPFHYVMYVVDDNSLYVCPPIPLT